MPGVILKSGEPLESAVRRYKRTCEKARIFSEVRRREYYEKPAEARKRRFSAAVKRWRKHLMRNNLSFFIKNKHISFVKKKRRH